MSKSEKCTPRLAVRDSDGKLLLSHVVSTVCRLVKV